MQPEKKIITMLQQYDHCIYVLLCSNCHSKKHVTIHKKYTAYEITIDFIQKNNTNRTKNLALYSKAKTSNSCKHSLRALLKWQKKTHVSNSIKKLAYQISKKTTPAFSLIEAAFAILLIGIFSSALIPYWHTLNAKHNLAITQLRANYIRKSMEGYVARYGFLPSAASDTRGIEKQGISRGFVPYKTLGIPRQYIFDAKGNPFSFIVNEHLMLAKYQNNPLTPLPISFPIFFHPSF